jgi:hypothetical protein
MEQPVTTSPEPAFQQLSPAVLGLVVVLPTIGILTAVLVYVFVCKGGKKTNAAQKKDGTMTQHQTVEEGMASRSRSAALLSAKGKDDLQGLFQAAGGSLRRPKMK